MTVGATSKTASRRATVRVGVTRGDPDEVEAAAVSLSTAFSFALPPMAVGALWAVLLRPMYQPRPIPPAIH